MTKHPGTKIILETSRTRLREITPDDAENAYHLNLDPDVIRYTGDVAFKSIDEARDFLKAYEHYSKYGFGRWAVINKSDGDFLGWCGLKFSPEKNEHDIGFRFFKRNWNRGFATESALACLEYGFKELKFPFIVGRAMRANLASIRVLEKIGLRYTRDDKCGGEDGVIYRIDSPF